MDKDGAPPADVVESTWRKLPKNVKVDMGKKDTAKKRAMRYRSKAKGKRRKAKKLDEIILDDETRFMEDDEGNRVEFVAFDSGHMDRNRIILFCPKDNLQKLAKCEQSLSDSTFCTTEGFKQVFIFLNGLFF